MTIPVGKRTDTASRYVAAPPPEVYRALIDPAAMVKWRPPKGMTGEIFAFEPYEGCRFRMALTYTEGGGHGKTDNQTDIVEGRFVELVLNERVVEEFELEAEDPAFAGTMRITTLLSPSGGGTEVTIRCDNIPSGISAEDHLAGLMSTLANLAAFTERAGDEAG